MSWSNQETKIKGKIVEGRGEATKRGFPTINLYFEDRNPEASGLKKMKN